MILEEYECEMAVPNRVTLIKLDTGKDYLIEVLFGETLTQTKVEGVGDAVDKYRDQTRNLKLISHIDNEIFGCIHVNRVEPMYARENAEKNKLFSNRTLISNNTQQEAQL